ncbi:tetratricopeptide (TPR) repeat protein [Pedobacter cryoconitis]|uniref:type IX secretion system periplasmic lipoprotein PorW/SprE n=1 Tax=Pedobacter cryoconitis TaxID=188932 RepID=UPI00161F0A4E|nr:tetratricopeptide repeat protein [Pedobacter cryoconitis]MBB6273266.1 tetratricopeptide (TPR) repeat protein [Pedobacter cryoconitis]
MLTQTTYLKNLRRSDLKLLLFFLGSSFLVACSTPKDTATSRAMQNLTARYNYIYNANVILNNYEEESYNSYIDNYSDVLPVYTDPEKFSSETVLHPPANDRALDAIVKKSRAIIADKAFSNYIDDAYLLLGKAYYLKTNYFIAEEYFDYTAKTYTKDMNVLVTAQNWKARSLMQLNNMDDAAIILDTVYDNLALIKKKRSEPMATIAQSYIYQNRYNDAIPILENAVKESQLHRNRIRWTYILAQLYERQKKYQRALALYTKVQKSNAGFELYFNANLNRIKITGILNGEHLNRKKQLLALLKDDKNLDYHDQIYYQIAEDYAEEDNIPEAEKYYKLSIRNSTKNNYQKGLSYLRMADLNFNKHKDFLKAKSYYDSTVNTLPKNYPGYAQILKKSQNLEYITDRYAVIAFQDTLQMLAKLPEAGRLAKIKKLTAIKVTPVATNSGAFRNDLFPDAQRRNSLGGAAQTASSFYFSNAAALSRGLSDFQTKWGNRKLEDNWRQSIKSSSQTTSESIAKVENDGYPTDKIGAEKLIADKDTTGKHYLAAIPLTPDALAASNGKIIDAYYEIASFYQQELDDQPEAIRIYQLILSRFPDNNHMGSIYYSLYLASKKSDPASAAKYKALVLEKFPASIYAKTLLDPDYSMKQSDLEAAGIKKYNQVFELYEGKAFPAVITEVNSTIRQSPAALINPQLSYLRAIAIGRTQSIDSLTAAFKSITSTYPDDKLIVPLVKDHLAYIATHQDEFRKRRVALPDFDPAEPRFFTSAPVAEKIVPVAAQPDLQPIVQPAKEKPVAVVQQPVTKTVIRPVVQPAATQEAIVKETPVNSVNKPVTDPVTPVVTTAVAETKPVIETPVPAVTMPVTSPPAPVKLAESPAPAPVKDKIFSTDISKVYYFVVDVADASLTLSSSRFGIGQFNRGNFPGAGLKHQLTEFDNDQLIYVGNFLSFAEAKSYADGITPQLKQIMKVPAGIYSSFIISKENFEKLRNKELVTKYLDFYKNNY